MEKSRKWKKAAERNRKSREFTWQENAMLANILSRERARLKKKASLPLNICTSCLLASSGEKYIVKMMLSCLILQVQLPTISGYALARWRIRLSSSFSQPRKNNSRKDRRESTEAGNREKSKEPACVISVIQTEGINTRKTAETSFI